MDEGVYNAGSVSRRPSQNGARCHWTRSSSTSTLQHEQCQWHTGPAVRLVDSSFPSSIPWPGCVPATGPLAGLSSLSRSDPESELRLPLAVPVESNELPDCASEQPESHWHGTYGTVTVSRQCTASAVIAVPSPGNLNLKFHSLAGTQAASATGTGTGTGTGHGTGTQLGPLDSATGTLALAVPA